MQCKNGEYIIYRNIYRGPASPFAQVKCMAQLGRTSGDSYLTGNQINDSDCLFTHLLNDKDTDIQHGELWPVCGLIKNVRQPNCMSGVEFPETDSKAALPERQADFFERRNERTEKPQSYSLFSGQDAPEHGECIVNRSYEGCACPPERRLVPSGQIARTVNAPAEQETKKLGTAELLM